jgi:ABC-type polysaccharide transport system permease subunit
MDCITILELFYASEEESVTEFKGSMSAFSFRKESYNCHTSFSTGIGLHDSVFLFIVIYEMLPQKVVNRELFLHFCLC